MDRARFFACLSIQTSMLRSFFLRRPTRDSEDDEDDEKKGKGCTLQVLIQPFVCMRRLKFKLGAKKKIKKKQKPCF